ncbi:MAG: hypothetical protein U9N50_04555, partial [Pseudomonadota bacterium]|nr:hypothetical protein [Pseudomonadota bacterium]
VKRGNDLSGRQDSASVQGQAANLSINNGGVVIRGRAPGPPHGRQDGLSVKMKSDSQIEQSGIIHQVQVLEGREAYISAGEEFPVRNRGTVTGPGGVYGYDNIEYYPAVTGFYVIPRLNGNEVLLQINTISRQRSNQRIIGRYPQQGWQSRQNVAVSNISTTARGRLGEWIALGGVDQSGASRQSGIGSGSRQQQAAKSKIFVRVEEIKGVSQ